MEKKVYRSDRRNAARKAGVLNKWRERPRVRTSVYGERYAPSHSKRRQKGDGEQPYRVYTFIVGGA